MRASITTVTALVDDSPAEHKSLRHEHGLSLYVETGGSRILFDCGAGGALEANARILGVDLGRLDAVVLSHSHYDHCGGFRRVAEAGGARRVITGAGFFDPKYAVDGMRRTFLGVDFDAAYLAERGLRREVCGEPLPLADGCWALGGFTREDPPDAGAGRFAVKRGGGFVPDDFSDEVCLAVRMGSDGVALLVGCSHVGVVAMARAAESRLGLRVLGVWGGVHLARAGLDRLRSTLGALKEMGVRRLGFSHCSGDRVRALAERDADFDSCPMRTGDAIELPGAR